MDKKNTILLTVIAVATLLVAVVGATFAYYSVQVSGSASKVNVDVKSSAVGVLALSSPTTHLYMNILPADMANFGTSKSYFATSQANSEDLNTSNKKDTKEEYVISKLDVTGGESTTNYTCKATLRITLHTGADSMGKALQTGDVKLYLTGENVQKDSEGTNLNETLDLYEILGGTEVTEETKTKDYSIYYKVNGGEKNSAQIKAALELINKAKNEENGDQSYLAGKSLSVDIDVVTTGDNLDCSIDAAS